MEHFSAYFLTIVDHIGYPGVFIVMMLGAMAIPVGTEIILPGAGALVATGHLSSVWLLGIIATLGETAGCAVLYAVGYFGGRPFIQRYAPARIQHELLRVDAFYARFGKWTVLLCRFIPLLRGVSSLPAGISRMNLFEFILFTLLGSTVWCFALAYAGLTLGNNLDTIAPHIHQITLVLVAVLVIAVAFFVWQRVKRKPAL